jgi:hypothetical protein
LRSDHRGRNAAAIVKHLDAGAAARADAPRPTTAKNLYGSRAAASFAIVCLLPKLVFEYW